MGWARVNEALVARFGYRLKSGQWKVDATIHRPVGVLQRAGVLPVNAIRHWGARNNDWLDNAWLCMRNHANRATQLEWGGAEGTEEEGEGGDDVRSTSSAGSRNPRGRSRSPGRPGWPRKVP